MMFAATYGPVCAAARPGTESLSRVVALKQGAPSECRAFGVIELTGRLSRFSKIGGELTPHADVEEALHRIVGADDPDERPRVAVTSLPDSRRGERLIVLHKSLGKPIPQIIQELSAAGLPPVWIPGRDSFFQVDHIPTTGLGKIDLGQVRIQAAQLAATPQMTSSGLTGGLQT